ncbi:hypothetical protein SAMN05421810_10821 [Amycolatopsis arida]|uniref:Uncharacterized protein n=1 Tax=Amycolatopsis arida TaxID=587909 RepID=A0A1I5YW98_9PSEU|nr:hypothetical protein [Amycolatopsis arida]TDX89934.1 hypothetical protein CLV69_10821 [Amycolatopsis arida]SFQ48482.1 hypothetical protein SAMN05421810_10821 [Amycolatopsis arida]
MQRVVGFTAPRRVELAELSSEELGTGQVRVVTRYSGSSAGSELTAYRGTNPYLTRGWDPPLRLFTDPAAAPQIVLDVGQE